MKSQTIVLTAEGKATLEERIAKAQLKIMQLSESVDRAIQLFGLQDDEYLERVTIKQEAERELKSLKDLLSRAEIMKDGQVYEKIELGSRVKLLAEETNKQLEYRIVETYEANPLEAKVSDMSPLGKSLLGKKLGERVSLISPYGMVNYRIDGIS